ncbi:ABC-type spermidine/putrescine transport system, ATPase component [Sphaerochaeta pleomorpha str. Grapes]|uniref:ABC-type spermidine/putrescine transport system, ATPase component n=1 Tax=Sphaerochaeta pleomorpha (strain ATCC BAA-1885 / DSM 22778 / Grapes) TaxID=158190 RepID=G8QTY8_SPHPG|nr:ABC transporter ATP-binding protein [Sphaerochaeta pleomorpha]AEV29164.1 ABC-type spermidine/putrescine transport system, ATPase component [Sphaerochaeta pleomorpha str. Grapes]
MADIIFKNVSKAFEGKQVLSNLSFTIKSGECFTILGPSGCGKTVILRLIAGFEIPDSGQIIIGDEIVANPAKGLCKAPEERHLGVVFQDYAVWPHKTVKQNVLYPLEMHNVDKEKRNAMVKNAIDMVNLTGYEDRLPYQLSGGQQQRVALARALVDNTDILLLDEPLTNLDANLREEMRFEIKEIQRKTGSTVLYVTHDQEVALAISDQIALMTPDGDFAQIAGPETVYEKPNTLFGFKFLGIANCLQCIQKEGITLLKKGEKPFVPLDDEHKDLAKESSFIAGFRPMDVRLAREGEGFDVKITRCTLLGNIVDYHIDIGQVSFRVEAQTEEAIRNNLIFNPGDDCKAVFEEIHWFKEDSSILEAQK